jgi:predicted nucleic acid-binding protein
VRVYLDAAPVIYVVEEVPSYAALVHSKLNTQGTERVASELTRLECRVRPLRNRNETQLEEFARYFESPYLEMLQLTREVLERATEIRAEYGFTTPDSIHLGAALAGGCDTFLTNDHRLQRFPGIAVEIVG